jgi:hypothetical protein
MVVVVLVELALALVQAVLLIAVVGLVVTVA